MTLHKAAITSADVSSLAEIEQKFANCELYLYNHPVELVALKAVRGFHREFAHQSLLRDEWNCGTEKTCG